MNEECLKLESFCPQGKAYRLSFIREYFHRRAENFDDWEILVAREGDRYIGVSAIALKMIELRGTKLKGGFYFDLRVHPDHRRQGIAQKLGWASKEWALEKGAKFHYLYCVNDNKEMRALGTLVKGHKAGGYDLLIWPVYKPFKERSEAEKVDGKDVHRECVKTNGPYDLYSNPYEGGSLQGYRRSFQIEGAGCSTWSNKGILEEIVESVPVRFSFLGKVLRTWPVKKSKHPHLPIKGEVLKGSYVYDFYSEGPSESRALIHHVNNWAYEEGLDYLYIIDPPGAGTIDDIRQEE